MGWADALRRVADGALRNIGFPVEERAPEEQALIAASLRGIAKEDARKTRTFLSLSEIHEVVYGCIRAISNAVSQVPIIVYRNGEIVEDRKDEIKMLFRRPNETMGTPQLLESIVWMMMAKGEAFTEIVFKGRKPAELWPIIADAVDIVVGKSKRIEEYIVNIGGEKISLKPHQVIHHKLFHPRDGYHGLSPISALREGVLADIQSVQYSKTLYENMAVPLGVLKTDVDITAAKARQLRDEWNESLRGGAGSIAVLGRGVDWKPVTISPRDAYFIQLREMTRQQVQTVFGCSDLYLGGASETPFAGSISAIKAFWENTIFPLLAKIESIFNNQLLIWFDDAWIEFDRNQVELLNERAQTHEALLRAGVPQKFIWPLVWKRPCPLPDDIASISYVPGNIIQAGVWNQSIAGPPPEDTLKALEKLADERNMDMKRIMLEIQRLNKRVAELEANG
jgi:HK97 family phage portal protein